jgi:hypothetical protein
MHLAPINKLSSLAVILVCCLGGSPAWTAVVVQAAEDQVKSASPGNDPVARDLFYVPFTPGAGVLPPPADSSTGQSAEGGLPPPPDPSAGQGAEGGLPPPPSYSAPLGLRYHILLKDRDQFRQVNYLSFRSGQQIRLVISTNVNGHLYILSEGSKGTRRLIFPDPRMKQGEGSVQCFQEFEIPGNGFFAFDDTAGGETLHIVISPQPVQELQELAGGEPLIDEPVWSRIEEIFKAQKLGCAKAFAYREGKADGSEAPQGTNVGAVPATYVVQFAPLFHHPIQILHYR